MEAKIISPADALVMARVLVAIERKIALAWRENRPEDACSMARLIGQLQIRFFGWETYGATVLDRPREEAAA